MGKWKEYRLGEIVNLKRGYDLPNTKRVLGEYPIVSSSGITDYHDKYKKMPPGVVTGRYGTIGKVFYIEKPFWPLNTTLYVTDFMGNDPKFIFYFFKTFDFEKYSDKSTVPGINRNHLHSEDIIIPPLPEQRSIASILSSLDDKIDLLHRQNQTLEKMAETLFRQWFVEEAKEDWEKGKLVNEFDFTMGASPPGESYNEEGIGMPMYQGNADFGFRFPTNRVFTTDPKRFAKKFDTLISVRAPVGEQNMANEECCIGRGVAAFRFKANNSFFSYTFYKIKSLMNDIKQFNETGTVFGSISKTDFENIEIVMPDLDSIKRFQSFAKPIDDKIMENTTQIHSLTALRDILLPKLMSGEVRVDMSEKVRP